MEIAAPVLGLPAGHMVVDFTAGDPGSYEITLEMNGGRSVTLFVGATD